MGSIEATSIESMESFVTTDDTDNINATAMRVRKPRNGWFKNLLIELDRREGLRSGWALPYVLNRVINIGLGLPGALLVSVLCWALVDFIVPVVDTELRFSNVWSATWPNLGARQFIEVLDRCDLWSAFLDRVEIVAIISVFFFGYSAGDQFRRSMAGRSQPDGLTRGVVWVLTIWIVIGATAVYAIYRSPIDPSHVLRCVQNIQQQSDF
jgi:hypothetical protein